MDVNGIVELINSVGFPIIACVFMYMQVQKLNNIILELSTTLKAIDSRIDNIQDEIGKMGGPSNDKKDWWIKIKV